MAIAVLSPTEVLTKSREALGLNASQQEPKDSEFLASAIRHAAGFLCPCSSVTLKKAIIESLQYILSTDDLARTLDDAIEGLTVGGDLLELNQVTTDNPDVKGTWLFAAPPSYIVRPNGGIFLTGIVPDRDTYLPQELMTRIRYDGFTRAIMPTSGEQLGEELSALGLQQLNSNDWLRAPKPEDPGDFAARFVDKLSAMPCSGEIPGLQIIEPSSAVTYYRGRWTQPKQQNGTFVGRRPQEFGAPRWCFVRLKDGEPEQLLDLPLSKSKFRGCDVAWHLQMAIDRKGGIPQEYRVRRIEQYVFIDFFSPLPLWAERRLMLLGRHADATGCLFSYRLPLAEQEEEEKFLKERLWLSPHNNG